jgi:hypothetical protein
VSVLDQFRDAEQRVAERLKELAPAVAEYRQLEEVARRLGIDPAVMDGPSRPAAGRVGGTSQRRRRRRATAEPSTAIGGGSVTRAGRSRVNAAPGQRAEQLMALVRARPGVTVREAAAELGVDPTSLYRIVHRLEQRGELSKNGRSLEPAGGGG